MRRGVLAARGESPAAFDRRCIPPRGVAPWSHKPTILPRRVLPGGRLTGLGATRDFHHGLLMTGWIGGLVVCGLGALAGVEQETGTVTGVVTVDTVPEKMMVTVDTDQAICGDEIEDRSTVVSPSGGVANAVVLVTGLEWSMDPPAPSLSNQGCFFVPRVQVAKTRSQLEILSVDDTLHSTHAYDDRQRTMFNVALPFPGLNIKRPLRRPGVMRVECDSHGWMRGWVYVTNDVATVTSEDGRFEIDDVPPGTYELAVWHERYEGTAQTVIVTAGGTAEASFSL